MNRINPNWVTASRLVVFAPLVLVMLQINTSLSLTICLVLMLLSEFTDCVDGKLARATNQVSDLGKILDPLCDSVFHMIVWIGFLQLGWAPIVFVAIFFVRDSVVSTIRTYLANQQIIFAAVMSGKVKAICQATAQIAIVLLHIIVGNKNLLESLQLSLSFMAVLATIYSLYDYVMNAYILVKQGRVVIR